MTIADLDTYRTLVRVAHVSRDKGEMYVVVPGWDSEELIKLAAASLPAEVWEAVLDNQEYFHAQFPLGAEHTVQIFFRDWEIDPEGKKVPLELDIFGLPKPFPVPEGYVLVDEEFFAIITSVLTPEQQREIALQEGLRAFKEAAGDGVAIG